MGRVALRWLIRTFWCSLLWGVVGGIVFVLLFIVFLLGIPDRDRDLGR